MKISNSLFNFLPPRVRHLFNVQVRSEAAGKPLIVPLQSGRKLDASWNQSWKTEVIERFCRTDVGAFIDIGANLGQTLIDHFAANVEVPYIGFEPNPFCVYYLTELIRINALVKHTIVPIGLSDQAKILPFYRRADVPEDDSATLIADLRPGWNLTTMYIPCYQFDDVCQSLKLDRISLIKIDVEGAELEVLQGMRETLKSFRCTVLCEVLFTDSDADPEFNRTKNEKIMRLLADFDYQVLQVVKSADNRHVVELNQIEAFETAFYSKQNMNLCDYLFVPAENRRRVADLLLAANDR